MAISSPPRPGAQAQPHPQRTLVTVLVILLVAALLAVIGFVVALVADGGTPAASGLQGSGIAASQARVVPAFAGVNLAGSNKVTITVGGRQSVVVHADNNLISHVTTRVEGGNLVIGTIGSFTTRSPMTVDVTVPSLTSLTLSGSGAIDVRGVHGAYLAVSLPGSGLLTASGTVNRLNVTLGGSGLAQLTSLTARQVRAVVSGSGMIRVTAAQSLDATVSGSGAISYRGNPADVSRDITGSGAITPG